MHEKEISVYEKEICMHEKEISMHEKISFMKRKFSGMKRKFSCMKSSCMKLFSIKGVSNTSNSSRSDYRHGHCMIM